MIKARWRVWAGVAGGMAIATACASPATTHGVAAEQQVNEARASTLGAVVTLEGGCTAAKVGPKHLLLAARCVTNKPGIAIGKALRFREGDVTLETGDTHTPAADAAVADASADAVADASREDAGHEDAAAPTSADAAAPGTFEGMIAQVRIHPSYLQKCGNGACARGSAGGVDVADVAVIVLVDEIAGLPTASIELDPVSAGTHVLAVGNGCGPAAPRLRARETEIAKTKAAAHPGSPYTAEAARVLAASYVTTRGPGDPDAHDALGICSEADLGAPLLLANGSAIVGVSSNTTPSPDALLPMTDQYARVDTAARHGVGAWLMQLGVKTSRACTDSDAGCQPLQAPAKEDDAGTSAATAAIGDAGVAPVTPGDGRSASSDEPSADTISSKAGTPRANEATDGGGCSAAPRSSTPGVGVGLLALAAVGSMARRRRRR